MIPAHKRVKPLYMRAGNSSAEMVYIVLMRGDKPMRYCPIGAKAGIDVGFHLIESVMDETTLEVRLAAPEGTQGTVVVDVGLVEF